MQKITHFSANRRSVAAVVVTYEPCIDKLQRLLRAIATQVEHVLVIDNGSSNFGLIRSMSTLSSGVLCISLEQNFGIAYAQNVGIRSARDLGVSFVITLDQDSWPSAGVVARLAAVFDCDNGSTSIAAVGPLLKDEDSRLALPFFSYSNGYKNRVTPTEGSGIFEVDFLVSSGTLIAMAALEKIGLMREELFIAYVDVEFGLRARSAGFRILACCDAHMYHSLGDHRLRLGRWIVPMHSPLRHFYLMRGAVYMQKLQTVPNAWKRADRVQMLRSFLFFSFVGLPRFYEFAAMIRGIIAGAKLAVREPTQLGSLTGVGD